MEIQYKQKTIDQTKFEIFTSDNYKLVADHPEGTLNGLLGDISSNKINGIEGLVFSHSKNKEICGLFFEMKTVTAMTTEGVKEFTNDMNEIYELLAEAEKY